MTPPQFSGCCYVINYMMAKFLCDQFYPIVTPYDNYFKYLIKANKRWIICYSALPILYYSTSLHYFKEYHNGNKFNRVSGIGPLIRSLKHPVNVYFDTYGNPYLRIMWLFLINV